MPASGSMPQKNISIKAYLLVKYLTTEKQSKSTTIQEKNMNVLHGGARNPDEYSTVAYRYKMKSIILHQAILREEVEAAVKALSTVISSGTDTIPQN